MKLTKAFHFNYKGYEVKVSLVKNEFYKWYVDATKTRRSFGWGSNGLRVKKVVEEVKQFIDARENKLGEK